MRRERVRSTQDRTNLRRRIDVRSQASKTSSQHPGRWDLRAGIEREAIAREAPQRAEQSDLRGYFAGGIRSHPFQRTRGGQRPSGRDAIHELGKRRHPPSVGHFIAEHLPVRHVAACQAQHGTMRCYLGHGRTRGRRSSTPA